MPRWRRFCPVGSTNVRCLVAIEIGGFGAVAEKVEIVQRITHDGEVNRFVCCEFILLEFCYLVLYFFLSSNV